MFDEIKIENNTLSFKDIDKTLKPIYDDAACIEESQQGQQELSRQNTY